MPTNGNYDKPYYANDERFGRNKELTDEWTMRAQAEEAFAVARKNTKEKLKAGDYKTGKVVTDPPFSV